MMKKALLLLVSVCLFGACHKKEYPVFNYSQAGSYHHTKPAAATETAQIPTREVSSQEVQLASANDDLASVLAQPATTPSEVAVADQPQTVQKATNRLTLAEKVVAKKIQKKIKKAQSPKEGKKAKAETDLVSLFSLIAGGGGLILLLLGVGAGLLLGLIGLILGIVGLSRIRRGNAPSSSRTMAILGVVFGGLVTLLGLIVIAAVASYGFI
jgi:hypothetical protein